MADDTVQVDPSDPVTRSVLATEPGNGYAHWTLDDNPDEQTVLARGQDFLRTHAIAHRSYDETAANWKQHFPDLSPPPEEDYQKWQERAPREALLDKVRVQAEKDAPT